MEPNKYDTDCRTKINKREITPSADSWNRLEAMLNASENKEKKPMTWLFIAAGIIGFLFIGGIFFNIDRSDTNQIQVVEQSDKPVIVSPKSIEPYQNQFVKEVVAEITPSDKVQKSSTKTVNSINNKLIVVSKKEEIAMSNPIVPSEKIIKINAIVDENIDNLLAEASINEKQMPKVKVNARNLLSQVDGELELTFREKVIKSASENFQNIKVAVANRNLE